ncbi:MAG: glycosyltransferase family 92 protein [Solidesulfovibrio sp.]
MDYLTLCCIAKDENAYIAEWAAYHALLGVERLIVYDNDSRIPLAETLAPLADRMRIVVESMPGPARQLAAYAHCLDTYGAETKWLGFIDVDEFLLPHREKDLRQFLTDFEDYAALGANWVFFGSSGHETPPPGLVIENYTRRADYSLTTNQHIKSIVQPRYVRCPLSPHHFAFAPDRYCVSERGFPLPGPYGPHHCDRIQVNHYFYRSRQDFQEKILRGRGDMTTDVFQHSLQSFENQLGYCVVLDEAMLEHAPGVRALLHGDPPPTASPPDWERDRERVMLLVERKRIDLAEALSRGMLVAHNDNSGAWSLRAWVLALAGRHEEALAAIGKSLRIEQTIENLLQLFRLHKLAGNDEEARRTARYLTWRLHGVDSDLKEECASVLAEIQRVL